MSVKPSILLISDTKDWGGWHRGLFIKRYLSDEFDFDLITIREFMDGQFYESKYDLFYFLFHILLKDLKVQELTARKNVISIVTSKTILKEKWGKTKKDKIESWERMSKNCKAIFANNPISLRGLEGLYKGPKFYVPRGVNTERFKVTKNHPDVFTIGYVGKPVKEKGLEDYIRPSCKRTKVKLIQNVRNWRDALEPKDMVEFYNRCSVYIVASTIDGTPNPALEAMACGVPVISNEIGCMGEIIDNGMNGFLVNMEIGEYMEKINILKNDKSMLTRMGQYARQIMERYWDWKCTLNRYERPSLRTVIDGCTGK